MSKVVSNSLAAATSKLTAKSIDYGVVQLSWTNITDTTLPSLNKEINNTYPSFTLVRKTSGYPQGITDGDVLRTVDNHPVAASYTYFGETANYFVFDNGVTSAIEGGTVPSENTKYQGKTVYYALFLTYPDTGTAPFRNKKIAEASAVFVNNYGTLDFMLDHLPGLYKKDSTGGANKDLMDFLKLFAFAYDLYKTQTQEVFESVSVENADDKLIKLLLQQFGVPFDDVQDISLARNVLKNVSYLYKNSGSYEGIYEFIKAYTGYVPTITHGYNLMPDYNSASFEENTGSWYPTVDGATSLYGNAYASGSTHATGLAQVGPFATATATIGAFNNRQGVTLTGASGTVGNTTITVDTTSGLIPGSSVVISAGGGALSPGTCVVSVDSITTFTASESPTVGFAGSTLATSSNMITGMLKLGVTNNGDNAFALRPKIMKVDTLANAGATTLSVQPAIASVNDYVIGTNIQYATYITAINSTNSTITLSKPITGSISANTEIWASSSGFDKADAATAFLPVSGTGEPHTFSIYVNRAGKTARDVRVDLRWRKVDGSISASGISGTTTLTSGSQGGSTDWYRIAVSAVAPSDAAYCEPIVTVVSAVSGDAYFFDAAQWEHGVEVYSAGIASNVATVTTKTAHRFTAGDKVALQLDGSYGTTATIATVPTSTTFTYSVVASDDFQSITGAYGSTSVIYIPTGNTSKIAIGSVITVSSGTGSFPAGTTVLSVINDQAIYVSAVPTVALSNATIKLSQKVAAQLLPTATAKVSAVRPFEDSRIVNIDIAGTQVNEIANPSYWHSSVESDNFSSGSFYSTNTSISGTVTLPFSGAGTFGAVEDYIQKPVQIIKATGYVAGAVNRITYTTEGVHDILVQSNPVVYNMKNFFVNDPLNAGRGNGFDIRYSNNNFTNNAGRVVEKTDTSFTIEAAPLTLTGVTSGFDASVSAYYLDITDPTHTGLWIGAKVVVTSGTGSLSVATNGVDAVNTSITEVSGSVAGRYYIDYQPYIALSSATITASLGVGTIGSSNFASNAPTALATYKLKYSYGRNVYYNASSANYGVLKGIPVKAGVPYVFALKKTHSEVSGGYPAYSPETGNYTYYDAAVIPYIEFTNGMTHSAKVPLNSFIKSVSRKDNVVTFRTTTNHNFKVGDLVYISDVVVNFTTYFSNNISNAGQPYRISAVTSDTFSSRYVYQPTQATTPQYPMDGPDFAETTVNPVNWAGIPSYLRPPIATYAVTDRVDRYISGTASPFNSRTEVPWDVADGSFTYALPGFYIIRPYQTAPAGTHTVNITSSFFGTGNEFNYYFDGSIDPNNRIGGYLDTLWSGTPGDSSSHFYLNLASVSDRLRKVLPKSVQYANRVIGNPNIVIPISTAVVNAGGTEITFTSTVEHNLQLDSMVAVTGFTGNTAVNVIGGEVKSIINSTKFVVAPTSTIATTAATGPGVLYATNGWANLYKLRYADKYYGAPYSLGYGFRYNIFVLNSTPLDDPIYTLK